MYKNRIRRLYIFGLLVYYAENPGPSFPPSPHLPSRYVLVLPLVLCWFPARHFDLACQVMGMNVAQGHLFGTVFEAVLYGQSNQPFVSSRGVSGLSHSVLPGLTAGQLPDRRNLFSGIYLTLFVICLFVFDNKKQSANQVVKYTVIVMFIISTAHIVSWFRFRILSIVSFFCIRLITIIYLPSPRSSGWNHPVSSLSHVAQTRI